MAKKLTVSTDEKAIRTFLTRGVENVYPNPDALEKLLFSGKRITTYCGIDPTGPTLHIGHSIWLRKLAELQKLGHDVILLIGDFTAMIGDPTDKAATRKKLSRKEVMVNCKLYKEQASKFLRFTGTNPAQLKYNSAWLAKMSFNDVVELASHFTVQQMAERDMFETRMKEGKPVYLHEFLYPLMQGYDSVAMDVDLEIGGNDQMFNMLAGRTLLKEMKGKEKIVLTLKLLEDTTGKKMGKTEGNMITLDDAPEDMFGKVMSWTDGMIVPGFELCTDVPMKEIQGIAASIADGENPVAFKRRLAAEIVTMFIGADAAEKAAEHFTKVHTAHEAPEEMLECPVKKACKLVDVLVQAGLVVSKSEARRQIEQGGVKVDGKVVKDVDATVKAPAVLQKGKRHFVRLI
ncbi:MAG: tyrosine--tRNA ligase [Patescibacteria group bacterium]